jgi:hypothetical protein
MSCVKTIGRMHRGECKDAPRQPVRRARWFDVCGSRGGGCGGESCRSERLKK